MNRVFDYNGAAVSHSKPVKQLKTVKKMLVVDSGDRDVKKYPFNGDFVVYLPRVYENVVSLRLAGAEFPANPYVRSTGADVSSTAGVEPLYYILDIEGLNKIDECSIGADRSGYPDGIFAKIPVADTDAVVLYNDHSDPENIGRYTPAIGKLDRMHIRTRLHTQKQSGDYIFWNGPAVSPNPARTNGNFSLTFEIEMLDNVFDDFSSFESRVADRA
jgi:hypothetical protein